jgi:hypothetical protein
MPGPARPAALSSFRTLAVDDLELPLSTARPQWTPSLTLHCQLRPAMSLSPAVADTPSRTLRTLDAAFDPSHDVKAKLKACADDLVSANEEQGAQDRAQHLLADIAAVIALQPAHGTNRQTLIARADAARFRAKRGDCEFFEPSVAWSVAWLRHKDCVA